MEPERRQRPRQPDFDAILEEISRYFDVHRDRGTWPGGIHLELTGDDVTECIGGTHGPSEEDLARAYESEVDPRLNFEQSLELAFLIARKMKSV